MDMNNIEWISYVVLRTIIVIIAIIIQRYYVFNGNIYPIVTCITAAILLLLFGIYNNEWKNMNKKNYKILIFCGILLAIFLYITYNLIRNTENPAKFKIITSYELIILLFISYYFYNAKISTRELIGFILIIIGSYLILNIPLG